VLLDLFFQLCFFPWNFALPPHVPFLSSFSSVVVRLLFQYRPPPCGFLTCFLSLLHIFSSFTPWGFLLLFVEACDYSWGCIPLSLPFLFDHHLGLLCRAVFPYEKFPSLCDLITAIFFFFHLKDFFSLHPTSLESFICCAPSYSFFLPPLGLRASFSCLEVIYLSLLF